MKYKDIAEKYRVSLNIVKAWKIRHWNKESTHTKDVHTNLKKDVTKAEKYVALEI